MKLSHGEVHHIARLSRVGLTEAEVEKMSEQLSNILDNFEILKQVDTTNVPPTAQSIALNTVMREDVILPSLSPDEVLANAPQKEGDFIKVRAILEQYT
jgi:aspartyl-tRNA(Asn)/glutamyl-tRNA(Gln) amidotransferase subunit C